MAINALSEYERRQHSRETVHKVMAEAKARDNLKSSATILDRLKDKFRLTEDVLTEQTMTVRFLLHKSLLDPSPTIVQQVLSKRSSLQEVLWNFSRFKNKNQRVTLKQNPHFYQALPKSPAEYGREFRADPIETFQHATISVLTDNPNRTGRVFLETAHKRRVFGNAWAANDVIIFRDVCGRLEGESIVGADIQDTPNMWYFEEPPLSLTSRSPLSARWNTLSPTMSAMSANPIEGLPLRDWREPIHRMLRAMQPLKVNIHIIAKPPINYPPSPVRQVSSSGLDRILLPNTPSKCRPSIKLLIPALSSGPSTPSVYRTARDTPLSQRYPAAELSPGIPEPSFPTSPSVSPPQPTSTAATPSPVALSVSHLCRPFSIAPAPAGRANTATPITRTLAGDSPLPEGQGGVFPQEARISSQAPIAEAIVLPPGLDAACNFPRRTGCNLRRHEEGNEGGLLDTSPSKSLAPALNARMPRGCLFTWVAPQTCPQT
ncbi:hypothetical protein BC826DRAFT_738669 [Russula brevipes]|nr:hypothetical protein BC826DRAFT_738669 [Russula brevipes]